MLTAVGLPRDPTMRHFVATAGRYRVPVRLIDLGAAVGQRWRFGLPPDPDSFAGAARLDPADPVYCRLIDLGGLLPARALEWHSLLDAWHSWLELVPAPVVNRPGFPGHNACKPLHERFLRQHGFAVPDSLATSDPDRLREFVAEGPAIAKPLCGQRADCRLVSLADFVGYQRGSGPVYLQRQVTGTDVRAHVVAGTVIAQAVRSSAVDYRIDPAAEYHRVTLPADLVDRLVLASRAAGLAFAGWDLRLGPDTSWVFEVNPMPGYHHYDRYADGAITRALLDHLTDTAEES